MSKPRNCNNIVSGWGSTGGNLGVAYDPYNESLWISGWNTTVISDYSLSGTLLSSFFLSQIVNVNVEIGLYGKGALAFDPADGTLWFSYLGQNRLYQYSTSGALLQTGTPSGLPYQYYLAASA